jgi:hypothetical protein
MKNNIFISTSCRYGKLVQPEPYHHLIHHTHNTKEFIQYTQYIKGDLDTIDDFHVYVNTSIYNTVGLIRSDRKLDFMRFKEPLIDGKETSDGRNYLNNLNIK